MLIGKIAVITAEITMQVPITCLPPSLSPNQPPVRKVRKRWRNRSIVTNGVTFCTTTLVSSSVHIYPALGTVVTKNISWYGEANMGTGAALTGVINRLNNGTQHFMFGQQQLVYETHPFITDEEREYLDKEIMHHKMFKVPWQPIPKCMCFSALFAAQFKNHFGFLPLVTREGVVICTSVGITCSAPFNAGMEVNVNDITIHYAGTIMTIIN
nr:unnamed protein product [Callosobruchus analis]